MFDDNKFLKGTSGEVFLNNTKLLEINKVNIKMTGQYEDFSPVGDYCSHHMLQNSVLLGLERVKLRQQIGTMTRLRERLSKGQYLLQAILRCLAVWKTLSLLLLWNNGGNELCLMIINF